MATVSVLPPMREHVRGPQESYAAAAKGTNSPCATHNVTRPRTCGGRQPVDQVGNNSKRLRDFLGHAKDERVSTRSSMAGSLQVLG